MSNTRQTELPAQKVVRLTKSRRNMQALANELAMQLGVSLKFPESITLQQNHCTSTAQLADFQALRGTLTQLEIFDNLIDQAVMEGLCGTFEQIESFKQQMFDADEAGRLDFFSKPQQASEGPDVGKSSPPATETNE